MYRRGSLPEDVFEFVHCFPLDEGQWRGKSNDLLEGARNRARASALIWNGSTALLRSGREDSKAAAPLADVGFHRTAEYRFGITNPVSVAKTILRAAVFLKESHL